MEVKLCERFGWTYQELYTQPSEFLKTCMYVIQTEQKFNNTPKPQ